MTDAPADGISISGINFWNQLRNTNGINDFVYYDDFNTVAVAVPEPASIALLGFGALAVARRRRV